jgi:YfiR/HmsC-like
MRQRRPRRWIWSLALLPMVALPLRAQTQAEYNVKAIYLTKFAPFIEWPDQALASGSITICVVGEDPFGSVLDKAAAASTGGRGLTVRRIATIDTSDAAAFSKCQIAYVNDPLTGLDVIDALKTKPVVTVTDSGMRMHGVISFVMQDNHVRFDIDDALAEKNGIHFSSKLLELARAVTRKGEGP